MSPLAAAVMHENAVRWSGRRTEGLDLQLWSKCVQPRHAPRLAPVSRRVRTRSPTTLLYFGSLLLVLYIATRAGFIIQVCTDRKIMIDHAPLNSIIPALMIAAF